MMTLVKVAAAAALALALNAGFAHAFQGDQPTGIANRAEHVRVGTSLGCLVAGTPAEFPDDLVIKNTGTTTIPGRRRIVWRVANSNQIGGHLLQSDLAPGAVVTLRNVLGAGVEAGTACSARMR